MGFTCGTASVGTNASLTPPRILTLPKSVCKFLVSQTCMLLAVSLKLAKERSSFCLCLMTIEPNACVILCSSPNKALVSSTFSFFKKLHYNFNMKELAFAVVLSIGSAANKILGVGRDGLATISTTSLRYKCISTSVRCSQSRQICYSSLPHTSSHRQKR